LKQIKKNKRSNDQEISEQINEDDDDLDHYFESEVKGNTQSENIQSELSDQLLMNDVKALGLQDKIPMNANIFEYYENLRTKGLISEDIFDMVMVVLSAPATQVSVERAFSALGLVLPAKRSSLKDSTIDDILICYLNLELLSLFHFEIPNPPSNVEHT
jgi:hypothetical protein